VEVAVGHAGGAPQGAGAGHVAAGGGGAGAVFRHGGWQDLAGRGGAFQLDSAEKFRLRLQPLRPPFPGRMLKCHSCFRLCRFWLFAAIRHDWGDNRIRGHDAMKRSRTTALLLMSAAPLLFTALSNQFWSTDMMQPIANLPVTIFKFAMSPFAEWQQLAWAGVLLITLCVLLLNILARVVFAKNKHG